MNDLPTYLQAIITHFLFLIRRYPLFKSGCDI